MVYYQKGWLTERSRVYKELSERENLFKNLDSTFFSFTPPEAGWINMEMYLNGEKRLTCACSCVYDPFPDMKRWLEDIVRSRNMETTMHIDCEGEEMYLHYEKLRDADFVISTKDKWRHSRTDVFSEIGLFYVYDSCSDTIPFYALCETGDFGNSIYLALLALFGNCYNTQHSNFAEEWFYDENDLRKGKKLDHLTVYNSIKSPLIEWKIQNPQCFCGDKHFRKMPKIKETVSMWCDFCGALFWGSGTINEGACIGDVESISTDTAGEIRLDSIKGLKEWYNEYDSAHLPEKDWSKKRWNDFQERGFSFALEVRKLLPDTIDLFYYDWYPRKKVVHDGDECVISKKPKIVYKHEARCPMIVFNENCLPKTKK
jgi:hypothetical protein